jgi:cytochrome b subunit of formate dehydrogenase
MNQRQLASVLFAAAGVLIAAFYIPLIPVQVGALTPSVPDNAAPAAPPGQHLVFILGLTSSVLAVLIGTGLVLWRDRLADRLFRPGGHSLSSGDIHAVALSVLGCYFAVHGLSRLAWGWESPWSGAIQLVLGIGLFFGARGLSRLWSAGRSVGVSRDVTDDAV